MEGRYIAGLQLKFSHFWGCFWSFLGMFLVIFGIIFSNFWGYLEPIPRELQSWGEEGSESCSAIGPAPKGWEGWAPVEGRYIAGLQMAP